MSPVILLAQTSFRPLFGNQWLALLAVLGGVAVLMVIIAAVGRHLAATHPDSPKAASAAATPAPVIAPPVGATPEIIAVIAASVATHLGAKARITMIRPAPLGPNVESLMAQWSLEGRRQIYSSHQVR